MPILLHGLFNLFSQILDIFVQLPGTQPLASVNIAGVIVDTMLLSAPFFVAGAVLLRKVNPDIAA